MTFLADYGLFLLKFLTVLGVGLLAVGLAAGLSRKAQPKPGLKITHLNDTLKELGNSLRNKLGTKAEAKKRRKERKKEAKKDRPSDRPRTFVIDFKGDLRATATDSLRQEVSAILEVAGSNDEVLVRLENAGGTVHEHGLAASQLVRIREHGVKLTVAVDKVAASGGYLMATVADRIIAAPFAIVGSIGVVAQLPNFNRFLKDKGIDFEQVAAGRFKRTLTVFGENTEEGREKLKSELQEVHALFQDQIRRYRPQVNLELAATGEYWYGTQALELDLVDEIRTSDDFLIAAMAERDLFGVKYERKKTLQEKFLGSVESALRSF